MSQPQGNCQRFRKQWPWKCQLHTNSIFSTRIHQSTFSLIISISQNKKLDFLYYFMISNTRDRSEKMVGRQMGWITTVRTHTLRLILCNYQTPLPSHISHMWHMVQPVVLRSGHLHVLSSAIIWLFPIQCRACILQTLRRTVLLFTGLVAHTSKDELLTQSSTGTREFMKYVQFLHVSWTKWWNIPALERHFANTFSSGGFLPRLTLHDRRAAWLWCADCGIHQRIVIPRCIHACNENFFC